MMLRLLHWQGAAGIAATLCAAAMLVLQKAETRHWRKQSGHFEDSYLDQREKLAITVANYRAAADAAHVADRANAERVAAAQSVINERTKHDLEARLAAARNLADRLRRDGHVAVDPGAGRGEDMPRLSATTGGTAQGAGQDRLPHADALTATEQAIQLDELINWVRAQAKVDNNTAAVASPRGD